MNYINNGLPATQINDPATGSGGGPITTKISLSSAQILTSNTSPITLIPAPGVGKGIVISGSFLNKKFNTIAYATNLGGKIRYENYTNPNNVFSFSLGFTQNENEYGDNGNGWGSTTTLIENQPIIFTTQTGNPTDGDGTMDIYITYTIIDL